MNKGIIFAQVVSVIAVIYVLAWSFGFYIVAPLLDDNPKKERGVVEAFYTKQCIDGVQYLQFLNAVIVQVDENGKPITCSN